ncbi:hypothetical protein PISMIDRAFT_591155 [Pisolithus microcarpus 441]|uniref:Uncharacterized protein n=1 Tax=Pisolithus microcarpus 441 TaxID=765257 RepID=A0A0C9YUH0_9AGAM|nr:hypothetical protein PISMIDRAFT_591155 [Pisolithus microcarpus 441]
MTRSLLLSLIGPRRTYKTCTANAVLHITVLKTVSSLILPIAGHWVGYLVSGRRSKFFIPGLTPSMSIIREMLAIRHMGRVWLGFLFLVTLPSYARDESVYEGPCLPITLGSWLYEFGEDALVCDPCCVVILPVDNPTLSVTVASLPSATSLSSSLRPASTSSLSASTTSALYALTTPFITLHSTGPGTYFGQVQESGSNPGCAGSQSLAFTALSPITFPPTLTPSPVSSPLPASTTPYMVTLPNDANVRMSKPSATVIAVISIASFLGLASLVLAALLYARARRSQQHSRIRVSDSEVGNLNMSKDWTAPGETPPRPRNPYEGFIPSHVPLLPPDPGPPVIHVTASSPGLQAPIERS